MKEEIERLRAALEECAAGFIIGGQDGIHYEAMGREFNRRQQIAAHALWSDAARAAPGKPPMRCYIQERSEHD